MAQELTLLTVHAHPDDETIGTGGTLARYGDAGIKTVLVCATDGQLGEIVDAELNTPETQARLGEVRREELRCAAGALGIRDLRFFGYHDSGMAGTPANQDPQAFVNADLDKAVERLVSVIRETRPQVVVTYDERGGYGHPDHITTHRMTMAAIDAAADPARYPAIGPAPWQPAKVYYIANPRSRFLRMQEAMRKAGRPTRLDDEDFDINLMTVPDELVTTRIDIRAYADRKRQALRCHRTQIPPDRFMLALPDSEANDFVGYEHFILVRGKKLASGMEEDLFEGVVG